MLIGTGSFSPGPGHMIRGTFTLTQETGGIRFLTDEEFFFDGSPAPGFALSLGVPSDPLSPQVQQNAKDTDFLRIADRIEPVNGQQSGLISSRININDYDTVFLWCFEIPSILGVGPIQRV
ncbi:MAG: hypothetical protein AAF922_11540 [Pseudomonadota bacterium]